MTNPDPRPRETALTLQDIQRKLGIGTAAAMRVQAALAAPSGTCGECAHWGRLERADTLSCLAARECQRGYGIRISVDGCKLGFTPRPGAT